MPKAVGRAVQERPGFSRADDEMRRRSVLLSAEVLRWPGTRAGKMFGMQSVYRGEVIFALLPTSRCLWGVNTIAVKMNGAASGETKGPEGNKWQSVLVEDDAGLRGALEKLNEAYLSAKG